MTTVGIVGGVGFAAAAAVAGAIGLGALALAALGGRRNQRRRKTYTRRYGREVKDQGRDEAALETMLRGVLMEDGTGCARKLVCELAKENENELFEEELDILNFLGPDVKPGEGVLPQGGATGEFQKARNMGRDGQDCNEAFPACPYNGHQIMGSVMASLS